MTVKILLLKSGEDVIADVKEMVSPDEKVIGYFLNKPCVVKLIPKDSEDEIKKKQQYECIHGCLSQKKRIFHYLLIGWLRYAPIEKIEQMYKEDVLNAKPINHEETLNGKTTDKTNSPNQSTKN